VRTERGAEYAARSLLIATGSHYRRLGVPGEADYLGAGVHFCATCDGPFYKGKHVAVIGGGNSATEESLFLTEFAERVTILVRGKEFRATRIIQEEVLSHPRIEVRFETQVKAFLGSGSRLTHLKVLDVRTGLEEVLAVDGVFVFIGLIPNTRFLEGSGVLLDPWGFVLTGHDLPEQGRPLPQSPSRPPLHFGLRRQRVEAHGSGGLGHEPGRRRKPKGRESGHGNGLRTGARRVSRLAVSIPLLAFPAAVHDAPVLPARSEDLRPGDRPEGPPLPGKGPPGDRRRSVRRRRYSAPP